MMLASKVSGDIKIHCKCFADSPFSPNPPPPGHQDTSKPSVAEDNDQIIDAVGTSPTIPSSSTLEDQIRRKFLATLDDTRMPDLSYSLDDPIITMVKAKGKNKVTGKSKITGKQRMKKSRKKGSYTPSIASDTNEDSLIAALLEEDIMPEEVESNDG